MRIIELKNTVSEIIQKKNGKLAIEILDVHQLNQVIKFYITDNATNWYHVISDKMTWEGHTVIS